MAVTRGRYTSQVLQHPALTLGRTVTLLSSAVRKLSAVATDEEATAPLWRGVRGEVPNGFWGAARDGMGICAVDMAFMSASRQRQTPIAYMDAHGPNTLWSLRANVESDAGFHCGADVGMLSQFEGEAEVLFPPATMLSVQLGGAEEEGRVEAGRPPTDPVTEGGKSFTQIDVVPTFV